MLSTRYSCQILIKLELSRQIFEKRLNIKLYQDPSSGDRLVTSGQTDSRTDRWTEGLDEANSRFSQFRERA
jgi:hypothetical protein